MEVLLIAGAGIAVAAAVNAANKNNPDRVLAEQEKNALNALKKAQSKRPVNQSEVAQLEANYRSIQIERMRSTMERSEMKMVKYRNEGQIAKAEKHSKRAASLRAELMRTAPHVLSQPASQQFNQPQPYGQAVAAIPIASSAGYQSNDHKGTYAQLPTANQSSSRSNNQSGQGPYTLGDYMGTPAPVQSSANNYSQPWNQQSAQPQSGYPSQSQSGYPSQPQSGYPSQQQPGHQYPGNQRQGAALPEAREVLRTSAVSPLPQFQGSSSNAATNGPASHQSAASQLQGSSSNTASNGAASYQSNNQSANPPGYHLQSNTQSANQPSSYSASQQSNNRNVKNDPPIAREVLRTPDVMPMSQFQSSVASAPGGPALHIDLSHDVPPPSYNPVAAPAAPQQQAYQNMPPPAYVPEDWSMPSKK